MPILTLDSVWVVTASLAAVIFQVLVIGGGDGGVVREVIKHPKVKEVVLCEIDQVGNLRKPSLILLYVCIHPHLPPPPAYLHKQLLLGHERMCLFSEIGIMCLLVRW